MKLVLINNSSDAFSYLSGTVIVPAANSLDVSSSYWFSLYSDIAFIADIRLNNLKISDGVTELSMPESEEYLKYLNNSFNYNNKDIDGATIVRTKAAKKGWSFWAVPPEIVTSTLGGTLYAKDSNGVDIPGITCKIYDSDNNEITTAGLANVNLLECVKTVLDFEPAFDYEIVGGSLRVNTTVTQDVRMWIVGAPDIPAIYGGSKEFASGVNMKFLAPDNSFDIDGRVTKFLTYNATTHTSKMRIIIKHPAGMQLNIQLLIHVYRL